MRWSAVGSDFGSGPITQAAFKKLFPDYASDPNLALLYGAASASIRSTAANKALSDANRRQPSIDYLTSNYQTTGTTTIKSISSSLTTSEANAITNATKAAELQTTLNLWKGYKAAVTFSALPQQAQTVLLDMVYNTGSVYPSVKTALIAAAIDITAQAPNGLQSDWTKVANALLANSGGDGDRQSLEATLINTIKGATAPKANASVASLAPAPLAEQHQAFTNSLFEAAFGGQASADSSSAISSNPHATQPMDYLLADNTLGVKHA